MVKHGNPTLPLLKHMAEPAGTEEQVPLFASIRKGCIIRNASRILEDYTTLSLQFVKTILQTEDRRVRPKNCSEKEDE